MINLNKLLRFEYRLFNHIIFWVVIFNFLTFFPFIYTPYDRWTIVISNLMSFPFMMAAVYFTMYYVIPYFFKTSRILVFIFLIILVLGFIFGINLIVDYLTWQGFRFTFDKVSMSLWSTTVLFTFVLATALTIKMLKSYHQLQLEKINVEKLNLQNELTLLKSQITPHFIFNTLNNIDELMYQEREKASKSIYQLSNILRTMLGEMSNDRVSLETEMNFLKNYVELAQLSYLSPDFISYAFRGKYNDKVIAPMMILPLLENAIKFADRNGEYPIIKGDILVEKNYINLVLENKTKVKAGESESTGIGLKNLKKRLEHIYPHKHSLCFDNRNGVFKVELYIEL